MTDDNAQVSQKAATQETATPKKRGFAAMSAEQRAAVSRKGGVAAHTRGTAHEFTSDEARAAGRKGGIATHLNKKAKQQG